MIKIPELSQFEDAFARLNTRQKEAVETIEGSVMVVAGPGTGKTQILTLRIANILKQTDMQPENILALTFTDSGAKAMRERLRRYIGVAAYRVPIFTFHGFAQKLIIEYPDAFPRIIGGRAATDIEKVDLLETILEAKELKLLRPLGNPTYYVPYLLRMISELKQEYISPDDLAKIITKQEVELQGIEKIHQKGAHKGKVRGEYSTMEKVIAKNHELVFVYRRYEQLLNDSRLYDFDDMIIEAVKAMSQNEEMLLDLQETFQYVLADEHQDVNGAQNKILELLCNFHNQPNIFVVGDEKQAIYRFQGASLENFLYFMDLFPDTKEIVLTENYRSGQTILDAAHSLIKTNDENLARLRLPLKAAAVEMAEVTRRDFSHQAVEDDWLIKAVKEKIAKGITPEEIAIIVRTNREVETIAASLRRAQVAAVASAEGDVLDHPITKAVQALIDFVLTDSSEVALFNVLHGAYWGLGTTDIVRIASARSYDRSLASILADKEILTELKVEKVDFANRIMSVLAEARAREVHEAPHRVLEYVLEASGFIKHVMKYDAFEGVRVIRRLYDEIEAMVIRDGIGTLREVSEILALRRRYGLPLQAPYIATEAKAVQVMTVHKSKGLEFSVVFVPHLQDNSWGGRTRKKTFNVPLNRFATIAVDDAFDDDKRLLYVAMTRAKHELLLSTAKHSIQGKDILPARVLEECGDNEISLISTEKLEAEFEPLAVILESHSLPDLTLGTITKIVSERGFSATSINNYLRNPWDFIYRNILRIPEVKALPMQFGTAIHNVLEKITTFHTQYNKWPTDSDIKSWLEIQLRRLPISTLEYTSLHEKAFSSLLAYRDHLKKNLKNATKEEMSIRVILPTGLELVPELPLSGKLDRIDIGEDGRAVRVVDYKTGKPKTRNAIEGKTANQDGGYKRQLVFYALLLSLYDDDRYSCQEGVLSFVEPTINGEIKEEIFTITNEEIEDLKKEIIRAVSDLTTGEFIKNTKALEESEYVDLARQLVLVSQ